MKTKPPVWTYIITFLNPMVPSAVMIVLAMSFVMVTTLDSDTGTVVSNVTFMELHYVSVLLGLYFNLSVSLLYYYLIREGMLRPRWWMNLVLILLAYAIIPLMAFIVGPEEAASDAASSVGEQFGFVVLTALIGYMVITVSTKGKSRPPA